MSRLSIKPVWLGFFALLGALAVAVKLALALTAFTPGNQPVGYVAQDEVTNFNLKSGTETLFRAEYQTDYWSGNLFAYPVSSTGVVNVASERWSGGAAEQLDAQNFDTGRKIATMKDDGTPIAFRYASLSATQQGYMSSMILDFLRGDRSNELPTVGKTLRQRASAMGDIIHSRPYFVSDATNPTIFVGSNDGMLHAINASSGGGGGQERWAYVPSMLLSKMKKLADATAPYVHDYYVDGQINVGTILSGTKRIVVAGLGAGGKGLVALDITGSAGLTAANEAAVASKLLWEITPTKVNYAAPATANAYLNLGYTYGVPTIAKVSVAGTDTDVVIIGNGYNDSTTGDADQYQAFLFVINANTGQLISKIKAGTSGTLASPNGLSTPVAIDSNRDGLVDVVYAGDLNGTMWRFSLSGATATALLTTSPLQAITSTPGVAVHPNGGYMVNFVTGKMLVSSDASDNAVHYAYGIWDGATGAGVVTQTLTERKFTLGGTDTRVRSVVTSNQPNWATDKGWKVALPAGERVVGDGSFIENGRFYFTGYNPTVSTTPPGTTIAVGGENWLMDLDYLSGGSKNQPFLDLSADVKLDDQDRIKYSATDTLPVTVPATVVGDPILGTDGIPVGKFISIGVLSQPILVQLVTLNDTLFNQNPDVSIPPVILGVGVDNGHFDQDMYYGGTTGAQASATITVSTTGQTNLFAATLGDITVDGVVVVPALTVSDIVNGFANTTNAGVIKSKVKNNFTATVAGNVITLKAPTGASYNGKTIAIAAGTSQAGAAGVALIPGAKAFGKVSFNYATSGTAKVVTELTISVNGEVLYSGKPGNQATGIKPRDLDNLLNGLSSPNYTISKDFGDDHTIKVSALNTGTAFNKAITVTMTVTSPAVTPVYAKVDLSGGTNDTPGIPSTGWTDLKPALATTVFAGGIDATGDFCTVCTSVDHVHQWDDKFDVTGVDFLNPSDNSQKLALAIPSNTTQFKVLAQNQYLNPAVKLHIGNPAYLFNVDFGYIRVKDYVTSATLDLASLPTYVMGTTATAPVLPIGSLAINMPVNALSAADWWGNGDVRVGLHPSVTGCVKSSSGSNDGNMYQPVIPPALGTDGPGVAGWSGATTPATATGVRHNGALVIQIIAAATPNSAIELSVPGRPEYGWRVKSSLYGTYVVAEYTTFWHHPNGLCYTDPGWSKTPGPDSGTPSAATTPPGTTDPKIGDLSGGSGDVVSTVTTVVGNVTTTVITYANTLKATIVRTANKDASGNLDGSVTIVTTAAGAATSTTEIVANLAGGVRSGGNERGLQAKTGRVSWRELVAP